MKSIKGYITEALNQTHRPVSLNPYDTFVIVKPGFTRIANEIIDNFTKCGYTIARLMAKRLTLDEARRLYKVHKDEPFYDDLCKYMCSGICVGYCLKSNKSDADESIDRTNKLKDNIRKLYGRDQMRNAIHSSDSAVNVMREAEIFFL